MSSQPHFAAFDLDLDVRRVDVGVDGEAIADVVADALVGTDVPFRSLAGVWAAIGVLAIARITTAELAELAAALLVGVILLLAAGAPHEILLLLQSANGMQLGTVPAVKAGMSFPLDRSTVHLCIDMQRLFAEPSPWAVPWLPRVLPRVTEIAERHPERTVFTRFIPPAEPEAMTGAWRDYYRQWQQMTRERLDPRLLDLVEPLAKLVPPARLLDKKLYSAFSGTALGQGLSRSGITTVIVTGGETDVCVLATVMGAVDRGLRVVLPSDALCSAHDATHDALLKLYRERFTNQIETTCTERVLSDWT